MATDLAEVLATLKIDKALIGAASMGGCVALQFAGMFAERSAGLALIDTTDWCGPTAPEDWEESAQKAVSQGLGSLVEFQKCR